MYYDYELDQDSQDFWYKYYTHDDYCEFTWKFLKTEGDEKALIDYPFIKKENYSHLFG